MIKDLTLRRLALLLGGVALLSLGGAFFSCSGLGMDPLSVLYSGIAALTKLKLGTALFAANAVFLILLFFLDRKRIGLGTVAIVLVVGPLLNLLLCLFPETPLLRGRHGVLPFRRFRLRPHRRADALASGTHAPRPSLVQGGL